VVDHIEDMTPCAGSLQKEARRFGACDRADEVLRPTAITGRKAVAGILEKAAMEKRIRSEGDPMRMLRKRKRHAEGT
jgi:hypothetical protein